MLLSQLCKDVTSPQGNYIPSRGLNIITPKIRQKTSESFFFFCTASGGLDMVMRMLNWLWWLRIVPPLLISPHRVYFPPAEHRGHQTADIHLKLPTVRLVTVTSSSTIETSSRTSLLFASKQESYRGGMRSWIWILDFKWRENHAVVWLRRKHAPQKSCDRAEVSAPSHIADLMLFFWAPICWEGSSSSTLPVDDRSEIGKINKEEDHIFSSAQIEGHIGPRTS